VAFRVIGAGFGRTGTLTMQAALERRPGRNDGHLRAWVDLAKGRRAMDRRRLFASR